MWTNQYSCGLHKLWFTGIHTSGAEIQKFCYLDRLYGQFKFFSYWISSSIGSNHNLKNIVSSLSILLHRSHNHIESFLRIVVTWTRCFLLSFLDRLYETGFLSLRNSHFGILTVELGLLKCFSGFISDWGWTIIPLRQPLLLRLLSLRLLPYLEFRWLFHGYFLRKSGLDPVRERWKWGFNG